MKSKRFIVEVTYPDNMPLDNDTLKLLLNEELRQWSLIDSIHKNVDELISIRVEVEGGGIINE